MSYRDLWPRAESKETTEAQYFHRSSNFYPIYRGSPDDVLMGNALNMMYTFYWECLRNLPTNGGSYGGPSIPMSHMLKWLIDKDLRTLTFMEMQEFVVELALDMTIDANLHREPGTRKDKSPFPDARPLLDGIKRGESYADHSRPLSHLIYDRAQLGI